MERYADPLYGLLATLVFWWLLGDVLDNFDNEFLSVIAFGAAITSTVVSVYALFETLGDRRSRSGDDS